MRLITKKSQFVSDYKKKVLVDEKKIKGFSPEQVEKYFWENISKFSPLYGSDVPGTLFKKNSDYPWNLNKLDSSLRFINK